MGKRGRGGEQRGEMSTRRRGGKQNIKPSALERRSLIGERSEAMDADTIRTL